MRVIVFLFIFMVSGVFAQTEAPGIKIGDHAPPFILNLQSNTIQSYTMPYLRRIVLLHFWSSNIKKSRTANRYLSRLAERYQNSTYKSADGFEIIAVAVQTDKNAWKEAITADSLNFFTHGIALRGYSDEVCKKYGITSLPTDILIDDYGLVLAVNPRMTDIENFLDDRKNYQPVKKDVVGTLAGSSNSAEQLKFSKLYLFNFYGDSVAKTTTNAKGGFMFSDIKLNQDFILKVDNKIDITTSDPIALYSPGGEFLMDGRTKDNGFIFYISARYSSKLTESDSAGTGMVNSLGQIDVVKHLTFFTNGMGLTPKDELELNSIISILAKNKKLKLEVFTHTDARMDADYALDLTTKQAACIKAYMQKKGIPPQRIKTFAKGKSELKKICEGTTDCREEDHKINRRVEFLIYKD